MAASSFDRTLSLRLDHLVLALESRPSWPRRAWLRLYKRLAERAVPRWPASGKVVRP